MGGAPQCLRGSDQVQVAVWGHGGMNGAPQCLRRSDKVQVAVWGHDGMGGARQCLKVPSWKRVNLIPSDLAGSNLS